VYGWARFGLAVCYTCTDLVGVWRGDTAKRPHCFLPEAAVILGDVSVIYTYMYMYMYVYYAYTI